jgi:hydrogenase maturation protease
LAGRIIGVGQQWAGDDGVGIAVIRRLREMSVLSIDLVEAPDPTQLVTLLTDGANPVVIVDAVLDEGPAGRVLVDPQRPDPLSEHLLSTHGLGVMEAIELARIAHPEEVSQEIFIVGITIQSAGRGGSVLSAAVADAVPPAAARALEIAKT